MSASANPTWRTATRTGWLAALLVSAMVVGFAVQYGLAFIASSDRPGADQVMLFSSFNAAHFQPNYIDQGFLKRGLTGTLLWPLPDAVHDAAVIAFNIVVLGLLAGLLARVLSTCCRQLTPSGSALLVALWAGAPAGVINMGYDFGRLDHVNFILLGLSLLALRRGQIATATALVCLLTAAALLVHEAYLFYGVPLLSALGLFRLSARTRYARSVPVIAVAVTTALTLLALWGWGRYEGTRSEFVASLDGAIAPSHNVLHVWFRSLSENLAYISTRLSHGLLPTAELALAGALVLAALVLLIAVYRANRARVDMAAAAPLAVMPLFVLGIDYARWVALLWLAVATVITHGVATGRFQRLLEPRVNLGLAMILAASLLLGPIGTVHLFPLARGVLGTG